MERQSHTEVIVAPVAVCFDLLVDFERYPEVFGPVEAAEIVSSDQAASAWTVRFELNMVVRSVCYTLAYQGRRPGSLAWQLVEGDLAAVEGDYELTALEDDLTEATCRQAVDPGFWVPGPIRRMIERSALADSVREMKKAAEAAG